MTTMQRKTDPRIIRTRQMLRDALITLILEKGYDNISIQDITDKAGLRRATFYLHYKDKEELLLTILRETFDEIRCEFHKLQIHSVTPQSELEIYRVIFKHAADNAKLYLSILRGYGASTITRYIREYLTTEFLEDFAESNPNLQLVMPLEVVANFSAIVKLNMATWWLEQGMPYPPDQMAEMCMKLTLSGAQAAFVPKQQLQPVK